MDLIIALNKLKNILKKNRKDHIFSNRLDEFESLLNSIENIDDITLCNLIYGKSKLTRTYMSLKYRMEERLMNDVFGLSSEEENLKSRHSATIVLDKIQFTASLLLKNFFRKEAIYLFEKSFRIAYKFNFISQTLYAGHVLANHYGFVEVNERKMHYYLQKNAEMAEILLAENYVRECNVLVSNMYVHNKGGFNKAQIEGIAKMIDKMQILKAKYKTNTIIIFTNDLTFFYYQSRGDYKKALDIAKEGLEENINLKNEENLGVFQSKMNIGTSYFHLKKYEESVIWLNEAKNMVTVGTRNWFFITSLLYLNYISKSKFDDLLKLTITVISNKNLSKYHYFQEQWAIREAFLHFMIRAGKIDISDEEREALKPFIFSKFINSVPFHSKDKSGQNITILVLQILFLLSDRKYDKIIDRIDALTQYSYRYLRNDETFRSNCFIKMLILMSNASFNPIRTRTYTMELSKKLKKSHLNTDEKSTQVEIIPYDYLWEVILEVLERNK